MNCKKRNDHSLIDTDTGREYYNNDVLKSIFIVGVVAGALAMMVLTIILLKI